MNIYIVRHGETDWNRKNVLQGIVDIELNENGIQSAKVLSEKMKNIKFEYIYSSPLKRAIDTAKYICTEENKIQISSKLIERSFGDYEGKQMTKKQLNEYWDYQLNLGTYNVEPIQKFFRQNI